MKKLLLTVLMVCVAGCAWAESLSMQDFFERFPLKQGVAYSMADSTFNYLSTIEVFKKSGVTFELGYAGAADNTDHKMVGVISYPIIKLEDFVEVPILNLVELNMGIYGGMGNICGKDLFRKDDGSNESDWGISATLINVKF